MRVKNKRAIVTTKQTKGMQNINFVSKGKLLALHYAHLIVHLVYFTMAHSQRDFRLSFILFELAFDYCYTVVHLFNTNNVSAVTLNQF